MNPLLEMALQYGPVFGILAAVASIFWIAFKIYKTSHDKHIAALKEQMISWGVKDFDGVKLLVQEYQNQLEKAKAIEAGLKDQLASKDQDMQKKAAHAQQLEQALTVELEQAKEGIARRDQAGTSRENTVNKAMRMEGKVWERKVLSGVPKFRPLHERHAPVISVLNLKGGVGKTTVTAHLGASLVGKGYRVLLGDLDLQGSLSSLFVNESVLKDRSKAGQLLQHFLLGTAEQKKCDILKFAVPIFDGRGVIIPTTDSMAYAELNLTMRWLLKIGKKDNRFLLRRALHQKRIYRRFDMVLLDCPPIFNTCCVNALAASDYLIIPVTPSKKAAERVPLLLHRLKSLCQAINPDLQVLGILMNRTHSTQLTGWEQSLWDAVQEQAQDQWKLPVHVFETFIPHTTEVRESETEFTPPEPGSKLHTLFSQLLAELEERVPGDCRRIANVPHGPQ